MNKEELVKEVSKKAKIDTAAILLYAAVDLHGVRSSLVQDRRKETAALKIKATASWACECVCFTTAFFLLPSCGRLFHIYETWCFANIWREKPAPIPKKINAVGIAHIAYSIPLLICSTDRSETARTWQTGRSPTNRNNGFVSGIGSKTGNRKIAIAATKATI